jgi:lipoprotein-anchoring transpeptidase ErfK/SrfK
MPPNRPRPVRLNAAPRATSSPAGRPPSGRPPRPNRPNRRRRPDDGPPAALYWVIGLLIVLLVALIALDVEWSRVRDYLGFSSNPSANTYPQEPLPQPSPSENNADDQRLKDLQAKVEAETQHLQEQHSAPPSFPAPLPPALRNPPPMLQPAPPAQAAKISPASPHPVPHIPARALPLDDNVLDTERIAAYQVALERMHFSCGFVDGDQGMRTQRMLRAFQTSRGLPVTGFLDPATRAAIGEPGEPFLTYTVTRDDIASVMPRPPTWRAKAHASRLGYNNIWELLAEKFHCTRGYLRALNPDVPQPEVGSEIIGPKVYPAAPYPMAASLRVNLAETSIEALDANGRIIAFFPCSIAKDKNKRPNGRLVVKSVVPDPDYTFDPALFADAAKAEGLTHKMVLPPGPRNPVGTAWIGLSLPGYGIHGTPEPENISRTQSHGCFRLANWNAEKVLKMVRVGTPVDVEP